MDQSIGVFMQRVFFMSLLTINIFLESREEFFEKNQEALDRAKGIEELEIHLGEKGECYEQYCSFLNNTMSKYVIFYNEKYTWHGSDKGSVKGT